MSNSTPANKQLGQHWLTDAASLSTIEQAAQLTSRDVVLEIGPGLGTLTMLLVPKAKRVIAIELDQALVTNLIGVYKNLPEYESKLQILQGDIRQFDLSQLPSNYKIVANIPYYLTAYLLRLLTETGHQPVQAVLLVQKEVAERVAAAPGKTSFVSVAVQLYYHVSLGQVILAKLFVPPPKVDSQVLILKRRPEPLFPDVDAKQFFRLVKAGFSNRRKTLLNSLSGGLQLSKDETNDLLQRASIKPTARAQELSLDDWHRIYTENK